jgi:hypothetical protein
MTAGDAMRFGDVTLVSALFGCDRELPTESVSGKFVVDTNNYPAGRFAELDMPSPPLATCCMDI